MNTIAPEFVDDSLATIEERLRNWSNWAREKPHYRVTASLEGRYRAPPSWHPPQPRVFVDINDALKLERAIIHVPNPYKAIIIYSLIHAYIPIQVFCRKNRVNQRDYDAMERKAKFMVQNRVRMLDK